MRKLLVLMGTVLLTFAVSAQDDITGIWLNADGNGKIEIYEQGGTCHGKLVWLSEPHDRNGQPKKDRNNPDKKLRDREMIGVHLLSDLTYTDGVWSGEIYSPKRGKTLNVEVSLPAQDDLKLEVSFRGFSRTQNWTRDSL